QRQAVHRLSVQAETRPRHQEICQGGKAARRRVIAPTGIGRTIMSLRLIFMGTPDFSVPTLQRLAADGHDIAAVYTRAPKVADRRRLQPTPVEMEARLRGLRVLTPGSLRSAEAAAEFRSFRADAAVVVAYGLILPPAILEGTLRG